jgi:hypothetical protein
LRPASGVSADGIGMGDDLFYVDKVSLKIAEGANQGYGIVRSSISWVLGENFDSAIDGQGGIDFLHGSDRDVITDSRTASTRSTWHNTLA